MAECLETSPIAVFQLWKRLEAIENIPESAKPYKDQTTLFRRDMRKKRSHFTFRGKRYDPWDKNSHWKIQLPFWYGAI